MALHQYVPQDRLRALQRGEALPERCEGAALFADISGFTALTEALCRSLGERRGIEALSQRVNAAYDALIGEVERHGGSVIGFSGDAITCWFDKVDGAAAPRAVQAARAMQQAMLRLPDLALKVAVASGSARRFVVGQPGIQCIDALAGAPLARVGVAEGLARPGEVLLDAATLQALGLGPLPARQAEPDGERFFVLDTALPLPAPAVAPAAMAPLALPDAAALRSWVLPCVQERESAGQGLFVTDLRPATALFLRLGGLDYDHDDDATALLADVVARAQQALQQHGGVILELTIGDKGTYLYANFGAAQVHEDGAARAVRAALALRQALAGSLLALQMGISSGTMRVGGYGGPTRQSFGAIGDDVNTAARLMGLAQLGEILVSGRLRQALGDEFMLEARAPIPMKGKAEPLPVFAVLPPQQRRAIRLQEPAATTPLVGREAEAAVLAEAVDTALQGRGQVIALVGEAGMGKSRLLAEGLRVARRSGFIGYGGTCRMDGIRTPYLPWQTVWTAFFDLDPALPLRRQVRGVEAQLQHLAPAQPEAWPLLGAVLGLDWTDSDFTRALQPKDRKALLEQLLLRCLTEAAAEAAADGIGLLLVLEDLHAADPLSLDLLAGVARAIAALPVLVLLSHRPVDGAHAPDAQLQGLPHYRVLELEPLDAPQVEQVIRAKLAALFPERSGAVPAALIQRITERAQGNPFYVEELLNYLHDRGIDPRNAEAAAALELPASLHGLVLSRIDRLPVRQQLTLKVASIIGRQFRLADLIDYYPALGDPPEVQAGLDHLHRLGLTPRDPAEPEATHLFKHRVTQEVAYESLAYATRVELHGRYANHLERRHGDQPGPPVAQLAHHFERDSNMAKAATYLRLAGEQAAARHANDEALDLFERALRCLPAQDHGLRFELLLQREAIFALQGRHEPRRAHLAELDRLADALADPVLAHARVAVRRAGLEIDAGDFGGAAVWARAASDALEGQAALPLRVDALHQEARAMFFGGRAAAARPRLDEALALARQLDYRIGEVRLLSLSGLLHWQAGDSAEAEAVLEQALLRADPHGDARLRLDVLNNLGVVARERGHHDRALMHYEAAQVIARRIGDRAGEAMLLNNMGDVCLVQGDFHPAGEYIERALRMIDATTEPVARGLALMNRAEAHRGMGQHPAARLLSLQALELLRAARHRHGEAVVLDNLCLIASALGEHDAAVAAAHEALAVAREAELRALEGSILRNLGRAHGAAGRWAEADAALTQAASLAAELSAADLALEVSAARAELLLARGEPAALALNALAGVLPMWLPEPPPAWPQPLWMALAAWRALAAHGDPRADALLAAAQRELQRRADRIPDARARRDFLAIPEHAALGARPQA